MQVQLPYGKKTVPLDIPDSNVLATIFPQEIIPPERPDIMIRGALASPLGASKLSELTVEGDSVAIVVDDSTRPCPTKELLPPILDEVKQAGVDDADVTIIIANGTHKPPPFDGMKDIVGDKVFRNYVVTSNDITNGDYVTIGTTKRGNTIEILRGYVDADIKIILGDIEYHYFAGYGGTRKSILPGLASYNTIQNNHKLLFEPRARTGVLKDNPIHLEMNEAMHLAGCDFALNVVLNSGHRIVGAWAGKPEAVMDAGVKLVDTMYKREVRKQADIVVVAASGYPHDIDLYQAYKGLHTALPVLKKHGVIVFVAECQKGAGNQLYVDWMKKYRTAAEMKAALNKEFVMGAHKAYYHLDAIEHHKVIFVSSMDTSEVETLFKFIPAETPNIAVQKALDIVGKQAQILVVPQGSTTLLVPNIQT